METIEFADLFAVPIGKVDGSRFLPYTRNLYDVVPLHKTPKFKSTLTSYIAGQVSPTVNIPDTPEYQDFRQFLLESAVGFLSGVGFKTQAYDFMLSNVWLNEMKAGEFHNQHSHPGSLVSGCFYVDVPEGCHGITFSNPLSFLNKVSLEVINDSPATRTNIEIKPRAGEAYFWESHVFHAVHPSEFQGPRRSIAFDVIATNFKAETLNNRVVQNLRIESWR